MWSTMQGRAGDDGQLSGLGVSIFCVGLAAPVVCLPADSCACVRACCCILRAVCGVRRAACGVHGCVSAWVLTCALSCLLVLASSLITQLLILPSLRRQALGLDRCRESCYPWHFGLVCPAMGHCWAMRIAAIRVSFVTLLLHPLGSRALT